MNIGIFTETFLPNIDGVVISILNMNRLLIDRGHKVCVFTVGRGPGRVDGCDVFRTRGLALTSYKGYMLGVPSPKIMGAVAKNKLDVLHSRGPATMGLMAKYVSKLMGLPLIGTFDTPVHEYVHYLPIAGKFKPSKKILERLAIRYSMWYYNRCDLVTTPSGIMKKELRRLGCKKRIEVLSNGVDVNRYRPENYSNALRRKFCKKTDEHMLLHLGRITVEKGVDVLLKAVRELKRSGVRFRLVIVGKGPGLEDFRKMSRGMGLSKNVVFTGFVPDEELPKYYATADLFVTASTVETQGIVMLEAMASGTPVIGAHAAAIPELVKDGKNGFTFEAGDYRQMANRIRECLGDEGFRKRLSKNAGASVEEHSLERVCDKLEKLYRKVIKR